MRKRQDALKAALLRARRFLNDNLAQFANVVDLTAALKRLDEVIASFDTHAVGQDANKRSAMSETEKQGQLRLKLRASQMAPIAAIAKRNLRSTPEFKALRLPPRSYKGNAFIASAQAMLDAAAVQKDALLERGMPADFLDRFQTSLNKLQTSVSDRGKNVSGRVGATKGLASEEQQGLTVLAVIDALVRDALSENDALLGEWDNARRISRRSSLATTPSSSSSGGTTTPATPAANTTTSPATPPAAATQA